MPEVTGKESGNYAPAAENLDLPILSPSFNSNVCLGFLHFFFFETILTFHVTAKNCKEQTAAAQSRETKKRRQKRGKSSTAEAGWFFFFFKGREKKILYFITEHYDDVATHNENLVFY